MDISTGWLKSDVYTWIYSIHGYPYLRQLKPVYAVGGGPVR